MKLLSVTTIVARRAAILVLAAVVLVAGLPQVGFAQSDPLTGAWKLNLEKSKFSPGPPPKSLTLNYQGEGQNRKNVTEGIDAEGKPMGGCSCTSTMANPTQRRVRASTTQPHTRELTLTR